MRGMGEGFAKYTPGTPKKKKKIGPADLILIF